MMSLTETSQLLQKELMNDYSYRVDIPGGMNDSQYDFNHVQQQPPPSAYMQRTAAGNAGGARMSAMPQSRGGFGRPTETARPMTSNRAAGYTAAGGKGPKGVFDPMGQGENRGPAKPLEKKTELSQEEKLREMEKEIHRLVEESAITREQGNFREALEKAKEAGKKERQLCRLRETQNLLDQLNVDLTYAVCLNLAIQHQANDNDNEALTIYTQIVKNKQYPFSGRFRVNMGNIYFKQEKWTAAIKMYRMALDQIPNNVQAIRFKIMRNIGHSFFKMHQFPDAIESYENLLMHGAQHLDFMTGFNLILCYYALGDKEKMKSGFLKLLNIEQVGLEDFDEEELELGESTGGGSKDKQLTEGDDALREDVKRRQREAARFIVNAANLTAPVMEKTPVLGFDWVIDSLNHHGFPRIGSELEIAKASYFLRRKEFDQAITVLKKFERKEPSLMACAATNLSFLYFLEAEHQNAEKYADIAVKADRYNARALVNKGNCMFMNDEFERAKEVYLEAIGVSADCLEAIYNLGLVNMHIGKYQEALLAFDKLHSITHLNCEVMWQLGDIHEKLGNHAKAHEWFSLLVTSPKGRPTDPGVLARLANLFNKAGDETQAFHYHLEAYRYWPVDMNVITWLGIYYVKQEMYEAAIPFFSRASQIEPNEVKWRLMVASCYRRMGAYPQALKLYEDIHHSHPNDIECVRYLITICKEMKQNYDHYANHLRKLERAQEQQANQGPGGAARGMLTASAFTDGPDNSPGGGMGGRDMGGPMRTTGRSTGQNFHSDHDHHSDEGSNRPVELYEAQDVDVPKGGAKRRLAAPKQEEEDEWGDDGLEDVLPPM
jgi:intraflagellar transport protein 88